ncbi:hypothetical protein [Sabulicella glaciei]|uniref:Uncharacterized protein n=1 Tax=Sabulicella glaciei TaxID=2984948 RepID=A0ABT3NZQ6_9PROT|nr:hypothetical protein [Roseococcus sp. MDT2-1-1]MCW8087629.1 hypothetical protein [Roseococcus sp. MDT2-1-1]
MLRMPLAHAARRRLLTLPAPPRPDASAQQRQAAPAKPAEAPRKTGTSPRG